MPEVQDVSLTFATKQLRITAEDPDALLDKILTAASSVEPGVVIQAKSRSSKKASRLSAENKKQFYIPEGFAHGFLVLSEEAEFTYKCTDYYDHASEGGVRWDDSAIGIEWPKLDCEIKLSAKDEQHPGFNEQSFEFFERW